jgi:hypothetical protein
MSRKRVLEGMAHRTQQQESELQLLIAGSHQNWESYIWNYHAVGQTDGFFQAADALLNGAAPGQPPRNQDYSFWIHVMMMWIFEKRRTVATWEEAVRAYNGSGQAAQDYRTAVTDRRDAAAAAGAQHHDYVPGNI